MRNRTLLVTSLIVAASVVTGCGSQSLSSAPATSAPAADVVDLTGVSFEARTGQAAVQVDAVDNAFKPEYLEISAGTAVTFRNDGRNDHNVIPVDAASFGAIEVDQFPPGTEATVTFAEPGDYPYYCSLHGTKTKGMIGAIRVA